jgi:lipopolysaccharide export system permease protein
MLKRYDTYVIARVTAFVVILILILLMIYIVVDFSEKTDDFTDRGAGLADIVQRYYLPYIPEIIRLVLPVAIFIASLFIAGQMSDRLEMAALRSAGLSFYRLIMPYMVVAVAGLAITSILDGFIVPPANRIRFAFEREYLNKRNTFDSGTQIFRQESIYAHSSVDFFDPVEKAGYRFRLHQFDSTGLREFTESQRIVWIDSLNLWRLESAERQIFDSVEVRAQFFPQLDTVLTILPRDLARSSSDIAMLTYTEAIDYVSSIERSGSGRLELPVTQLWGRILYPFGILVVSTIGFTIGFVRRRGGQGVPIAIGLSVSFVYLTLLKVMEPLGYAGIVSAFWAAFLPHMIFGIGAFVLVYYTRK